MKSRKSFGLEPTMPGSPEKFLEKLSGSCENPGCGCRKGSASYSSRNSLNDLFEKPRYRLNPGERFLSSKSRKSSRASPAPLPARARKSPGFRNPRNRLGRGGGSWLRRRSPGSTSAKAGGGTDWGVGRGTGGGTGRGVGRGKGGGVLCPTKVAAGTVGRGVGALRGVGLGAVVARLN